jgi:DNA polymerase III epsilon subunit-like protein
MLENWIVFDTETTDLVGHKLLPLVSQPHVVEFSAIHCTLDEEGNGNEIAVLDFMCKPSAHISDEQWAITKKITGIGKDDIADKPPFKERAEDVGNFFQLGSHRAAHNLTFDEDMVDFEFKRAGMGTWRPVKQRRICTVEQTEHLVGYRYKLTDLHARLFGAPFEGAHRALVDVRATWRCIQELRRQGVL